MRFTAVQRIINDYLEFALKTQCVLPAFSMRFQREFDKYKNVGGRVYIYITKVIFLKCPIWTFFFYFGM